MRILAITLAATALPLTLVSQTTTTNRPVHHTSTATTQHPAAKPACGVVEPILSPKIPALPPGAPTCPSVAYELTYIDTVIGKGELAAPKKWYTVHYTGYLSDGTKFDSSFDHPDKEPITFPYGAHRVITGWDTGFEGMRVGGKRRLFVPYQLAYGEAGRPPVIPERSTLIFDVEFVAQSDTPPAPKPSVVPSGAPGTAVPPPQPPTGTPAPAPAAKPATPAPSTPPQ
jgi:peptidylprolyl isomerase